MVALWIILICAAFVVASRYSNILTRPTGCRMKYLLLLLLLGLAGVEYFHHVADGHAGGHGKGEVVCKDPETKSRDARELLRHHMYGHR